jgi:hypothetical protein
MTKKRVGIDITPEAHDKLKKLAKARGFMISGLIEKWIHNSYRGYFGEPIEKNEEKN